MSDESPRDLEGRAVLITGGNSGIGRATAEALARRGARVTLACRDESKTRSVIEAIERASGAGAAKFLALDLMDLEKVRASAAEFLSRDEPLHVLINNAGIFTAPTLTVQGFEPAFGVNHLGHFLFTTLLLERLRRDVPSRIVNVSSRAHFRPRRLDLDALRGRRDRGAGAREYATSKLCNVLFTQELARRLQGTSVSVCALHPGVIVSGLWRTFPWPIRSVMQWFMDSPESGAATSVYCATSRDVETRSGRYFDTCREKPAAELASDPELARALWKRSEEWTR